MKKIIPFLVFVLITIQLNAQSISLEDSTISFQDKNGEMLTRSEAKELMKGKFSMKTESRSDGSKIVTIIPDRNREQDARRQYIENFRRSLLGKKLSDFNFADINGQKISRKDIDGKVAVLNFWFTSCKPCIMEMPLLNELVASYKDKNVVFLAPTFDTEAQVKKFMVKNVFDYKLIADQTAYVEKLKVTVFPTHLIIDKKGIIKEVMIGYHGDIKARLAGAIDKVL